MTNYNKNLLNINPADNDSMAGLLQYSMLEYMKTIQGVLPAKVINYNATTNRVSVQLLINILSTSGEQIPNTQLASIPVMLLGGGGYCISFNLQQGDLGWVIATDRDMSIFLQNYTASAPGVNTIKNFSSSFFIPDQMQKAAMSNPGIAISNASGSVKITLGSDGVEITSPLTTINGNLLVKGNITATGTITP
jgi:hypothetical protein